MPSREATRARRHLTHHFWQEWQDNAIAQSNRRGREEKNDEAKFAPIARRFDDRGGRARLHMLRPGHQYPDRTGPALAVTRAGRGRE